MNPESKASCENMRALFSAVLDLEFPDASEQAQLAAHLGSCSGCRQFCSAQVRQHRDLLEANATQQPAPIARPHKRSLWMTAFAAAAAAAVLLLAVLPLSQDSSGLTNRQAPAAGGPVMTLASFSGALAQKTAHGWREPALGDSLPFDKELRVAPGSTAVLDLDGVRVELAGGAHAAAFAPSAGEQGLWLKSGMARITVTPQASRPFMLRLPQGRSDLRSGELLVHATNGLSVLRAAEGTEGSVSVAQNIRQIHKRLHSGKTFFLKESSLSEAKPGDVLPLAFIEPKALLASSRSDAPLAGRLVIKDTLGREQGPLELRELRVRTTILDGPGGVALTEIEETFFNPGQRQAEGTFYFALPAGASIARLAMWVDQTLIEGELVERARAREVYETIVKRMQDPALMEWQEGNVFKTRIFPIPAHGPKRILIAYTQTLPAHDGERRYTLPLVNRLDADFSIGRFDFEAKIQGAGPVRCPTFPALIAEDDGGQKILRLVQTSFRPSADLVLRIPAAESDLALVTDHRENEDGFFMLSYRVPFDSTTVTPANTRDLLIMFDTSLSRRADDFQAQLRVARTLLEQLGTDRRFALLSFDVTARAPEKFYAATAENIEAELAELKKMKAGGATDLGAAFTALDSFLQREPQQAVDVVMLGDGLASFGTSATPRLIADATKTLKKYPLRFHAVAMGQQYDRLLLSQLARGCGGLFRSILPGDEVEVEAFRLALALQGQVLPAPEFSFSGGEIHEVYPSERGCVTPGEELLLFGRYKTAQPLQVSVTDGQCEPLQKTFHLPQRDARHICISRLWAREKLEQLLAGPQNPQVARTIIDLSQDFTLITPYTSFLVLESEAAYAQWGIQRHPRRPYWAEQELLQSSAPEPGAPRPVEQEIVLPAEAPPPSCRFADFDLSLVTHGLRPGSREIATALCALTFEVYYRYHRLTESTGGAAGISREVLPDVPPRKTVLVPEANVPELFTTSVPSRPEEPGAPQPLTQELPLPTPSGRKLMIKRHGGSRVTESCVDMTLRWLAGRQSGDGEWANGSIEATSWSLLAFLGAGHTPKVGRYKENVSAAITFLLDQQSADGCIGRNLYEHAIAALALCEASGMLGNRGQRLKAAAQLAAEYLIAAQRLGKGARRGWCFAFPNVEGAGADPLVTVFAVMALRSAKIAGLLTMPLEIREELISYLESIQSLDGAVGPIGLPVADEIHLLHTAGAVLLHQWLDTRSPKGRGALAHLESLALGKQLGADQLFVHHLTTLAMFREGGDLWKRCEQWNKDILLTRQILTGPEAGSWPPIGISIFGGRLNSAPVPAEAYAASLQALQSWKAARTDEALRTLATTLSGLSDQKLLSVLLLASFDGSDAETLLRIRLAWVLLDSKQPEKAFAQLQAAYRLSQSADNVLQLYVNALHGHGQGMRALDLLISELNVERLSSERYELLAKLLFDPALKIEKPYTYLRQRLTGEQSRFAALKADLGQHAASLQKFECAAEFLEDAYYSALRPINILEPYLQALLKAGQSQKAAAVAEETIFSGYHDEWIFRLLADVYQAQGRSDELLRVLTWQIELLPLDWEKRHELARQLQSRQLPELAVAQYQEAVRLCPLQLGAQRWQLERETLLAALTLKRYEFARSFALECLRKDPQSCLPDLLDANLADQYPEFFNDPQNVQVRGMLRGR